LGTNNIIKLYEKIESFELQIIKNYKNNKFSYEVASLWSSLMHNNEDGVKISQQNMSFFYLVFI